jgi:hypothetical protein
MWVHEEHMTIHGCQKLLEKMTRTKEHYLYGIPFMCLLFEAILLIQLTRLTQKGFLIGINPL